MLEYREELKEKYKVKRIGLFGSYAKNMQKESSDIDILVEFEEDAINFKNYMGLKKYLKRLFGKNVDLVVKDDIKSSIKNQILKEVKYAEGF